MPQKHTYAPIEDLVLPQGVTLTKDYYVKDQNGAAVDVTGFAVRLRGKGTYAATSYLWTATGSVVDGPTGHVRGVVAAADSAAVVRPRGYYDGEAESGTGTVYRFVEGAWNLSRGVS